MVTGTSSRKATTPGEIDEGTGVGTRGDGQDIIAGQSRRDRTHTAQERGYTGRNLLDFFLIIETQLLRTKLSIMILVENRVRSKDVLNFEQV